MQILIFIVAIAISIFSLASLYLLKRRLHPLEILAYYLFYTVLLQQTFTIFTMNLHLFEMTEGALIMWPVKVIGLFYYPVVNLWLLSFLGSKQLSILNKILIMVLFGMLLIGMDLVHGFTGYLYPIHWSPIYGVIRHILLSFLTFLFMLYFRKLLRESKVIT